MTSRTHFLPRLPVAAFFGAIVLAGCLLPLLVHNSLAGGSRFDVVAAAVTAIAIAAGATFLLHRQVARPLRAAAMVIEAASDGELDGRVPPARLREVQAVAHAFNRMADSVQESTDSLVYRAFHDPLTGLPNRALFLSGFSRALAGAQRGNRVAVMFLDVDRFKYLNDSLGHGVGDQLLAAFSQRVVGAADGHMVARLGGDEFTVLVQSANAHSAALRIAERIMYALRRPFSLSGQEMFVTSSIGIAVSSEVDRTTTELLRKADIALYRG